MRRMLMLLLCACSQAAFAQPPVFDVHVHLHDGETSLRAYQADAAKAGIPLAGLGAMWFGGPNHALQGKPADIVAGNDGVIALATRHPGVLPIATVHPYDGDAALREIARMAGRGVRVLKLHPHTQRFDAADPRVLAVVRKAGEAGMTVLMDNAGIVPGDNQSLFNLALQAPKTRFVFAHAGGMDFRFWNMLALARTAEGLFADNIHFDVSAVAVLFADSPLEAEFVWTLRNVGIDRILLGSDYPQFSLAANLDALERLDLTADEKQAIRLGNARRLLGIDAAPTIAR